MPGVGEVTQFGPLDYSMRIWLDSDRLTALGLTPADVIAAIQSQNIQAAVGRIGAQPMTADAQFQITLQTKGRLSEVEEFENIVVRANPDGSTVRVKDLGRVELGSKQSDSMSRLDGATAAGMAIYLAPGANAVKVAEGVARPWSAWPSASRTGWSYAVVYDTTEFVNASLEKVIHTLLEAFVLVIIVVFLFLGSWRATLIPLVAVPVALVGTFAFLLADRLLGQYRLAARRGARHRHRGGRRHRRGGERRAHHGRGAACRRARRPRRRWARSPAPSSPSPWCCSRSSCRSPSSPASPASSSSSSPPWSPSPC